VVPDDSGTFYDQTVSNDLEEYLEEPVVDPEPDPEPEPEQEPISEIQEEKSKPVLEETAPLLRMLRRVLLQHLLTSLRLCRKT
jgi:Ras GTPase-activating protein-binding protein 1